MAAPALTPAAPEATNFDHGPLSPWERGAKGGVRSADALAFVPGTPLKEQAWALYCQGAHSPEIGRRLGISERTVRSWLSRTLRDLDAEHQEMQAHELALAIARKRQLSAAAWESYSRLSAIADAECAKAANGDPTADVRLVRQALSTGARYLALANTIDRDLVRLSDVGHWRRSEPRQRSASPLPFREGGQGVETRERRSGARSDARAARSGSAPKVRSEATADHRDDPSDAATLLDLLTPEIIARMAADGILDDDWPPALTTDEDQAGQAAHEHENASAAKTAITGSPSPAMRDAAAAEQSEGVGGGDAPRTADARSGATVTRSGSAPQVEAKNQIAAISANALPPVSAENAEHTATLNTKSVPAASSATPLRGLYALACAGDIRERAAEAAPHPR